MQELLLIAGIHLLGVSSPGPDLALVLKNSLSNGRTIGIFTALGIALGISVHIIYSMLGLAVVISKSIVLFNIIKLLGAAYLIWIGFKALRSIKQNSETHKNTGLGSLTNIEAFKQGFVTNILNPKVTLFFLSLFTQVISPDTSSILKLVYGIEMMVATFIWFSLVATFMTQKPVQNAYNRVKHHVDRIFGAALITLGIKVATGSR